MTLPRLSQPVMKLILAELAFGPTTAQDLQPLVKVHLTNVHKYLRAAHAAGLIYISTWERARGRHIAVWGLGHHYDHPRLPWLLSREKKVRYTARRRILTTGGSHASPNRSQ